MKHQLQVQSHWSSRKATHSNIFIQTRLFWSVDSRNGFDWDAPWWQTVLRLNGEEFQSSVGTVTTDQFKLLDLKPNEGLNLRNLYILVQFLLFFMTSQVPNGWTNQFLAYGTLKLLSIYSRKSLIIMPHSIICEEPRPRSNLVFREM